jgi:hypothetical protein
MRLLTEMAGLICIAILVLVGADFVQAMSRPRLCRIIAAGLVLLSVFSNGARSFAAGKAGGILKCTRSSRLDTSPIWKRLLAVWAEAEAVAFGKRGNYPFNKAGKKTLLKAIEKALSDIASLESTKQISKAESAALNMSMRYSRVGVVAKRPTENRNATCYMAGPMAYESRHASITRLTSQLPLIAKMAREKQLQPPVVRKLVASIEKDLASLDDQKLSDYADKNLLPTARARIKAQATRLKAAIRKDLKRIIRLCR